MSPLLQRVRKFNEYGWINTNQIGLLNIKLSKSQLMAETIFLR